MKPISWEKIKEKKWWWIAGGGALLFLFVLSDSVRATFSRRRAIENARLEMARLDRDIAQMKTQIHQLEQNGGSYETLVRKELGYLRPGEKEARFLKK